MSNRRHPDRRSAGIPRPWARSREAPGPPAHRAPSWAPRLARWLACAGAKAANGLPSDVDLGYRHQSTRATPGGAEAYRGVARPAQLLALEAAEGCRWAL